MQEVLVEMSKIILEYDQYTDRDDFENAYNGWRYKAIIEDFNNWLRGLSKYEGKETVTIDEARDRLRQIRSEYLE